MTFKFKNLKFKSPTIKQFVTFAINANKSGNQEGDGDNYRLKIDDKKKVGLWYLNVILKGDGPIVMFLLFTSIKLSSSLLLGQLFFFVSSVTLVLLRRFYCILRGLCETPQINFLGQWLPRLRKFNRVRDFLLQQQHTLNLIVSLGQLACFGEGGFGTDGCLGVLGGGLHGTYVELTIVKKMMLRHKRSEALEVISQGVGSCSLLEH